MKKVKVILAFILIAQNFVNMNDKARQPRNRQEKRMLMRK